MARRRQGISGRLIFGLTFALVLSTYTMYFAYTSPGKVSEYWFTAIALREQMRTHGQHALAQVMGGSRGIRTIATEGHSYSVNTTVVALAEVERRLLGSAHNFSPGGHWSPRDCTPRWRVAVVIPFRNRHEHLPILLHHVIPMLQSQRLQFALYVVEQTGNEPFNRAMLFNVGFLEAMKDIVWDCVIFHDVDHIPENQQNYYGCRDMPRHYAVNLDKYYYMLPYEEFFGGVSGLTVDQFRKINGFANGFWGWGGEDDDMWNRLHNAGYSVSRPQGNVGRYTSIPHHHHGEVQFLGRYSLLKKSKERQALDGLNNLHYSPVVVRSPLYTNITVNLSRDLAPLVDTNVL